MRFLRQARSCERQRSRVHRLYCMEGEHLYLMFAQIKINFHRLLTCFPRSRYYPAAKLRDFSLVEPFVRGVVHQQSGSRRKVWDTCRDHTGNYDPWEVRYACMAKRMMARSRLIRLGSMRWNTLQYSSLFQTFFEIYTIYTLLHFSEPKNWAVRHQTSILHEDELIRHSVLVCFGIF